MTKTAKLYDVWMNTSFLGGGDRQIIMRILANDFEQAYEFAKKKLMKPDFDELDEWGDDKYGGWMWSERDECFCGLYEGDCECWTTFAIEIDEIEFSVADCVLSLLDVTGQGPYPNFGSRNEFYNISEWNVLAPTKTEPIDPFALLRRKKEIAQ
jgi:hypothetical protein